MFKFSLGPFDAKSAQKIGEKRSITINALVTILFREEAIIEIAGWQVKSSCSVPAQASPEPAIVGDNLPPGPISATIAPVKKGILIQHILAASFVGLPRILGRFFLDIFGRDKASESSSIFLGYGVITLSLLILLGIFDFDTLLHTFKEIWRFFSPVEK
jgi:hypothetical protein